MNRLVIINGTASGLGLSTANLLLESDYLVLGINKMPSMIDNLNYHHYEADLSQLDISKVRKKLDNINAIWYSIIHCAGISVGKPIGELSEIDWNYSMER